MDYFQVAGINICVTWENDDSKIKYYLYHDCIIMPRLLDAYRHEALHLKPDMSVWVRPLITYAGPANCKKIYNQSYYQKDDKMFMTLYDPFAIEVPGYSISMSKDYSSVEFTPHIREYEHYDLQWVMHAFEGRVLYKGGIVLHGAAVEYHRKGIIFTGISGAGKSTQAHLWQKHRDALIINGDCPLLKMVDGIPKVYGTPWCGSSGESINRSVALNAVVIVKQGEKNVIKELEGNAAFLAVLANVLRSNFDENSLDLAIDNLKKIIGHIRVFELTCTRNEEAVGLLEKEILS